MFTGSIVALVTPMDENGNVCRTSLKKLIDYHGRQRNLGDRFGRDYR